MTIAYILHENKLTPNPNDYMARINYIDKVGLETVIERIIERGSTTTKADILAVLEDYHQAIQALVLDGFKVSTPNAVFGVSIKGVFDGADDVFDSSRHRLEGVANAGLQYRKAITAQGRTDKREGRKPAPNILTYIDIATKTHNNRITAGGMGKLVGHRLKFNPDDPQQGIFFIGQDGNPTRVDPKDLGQNKPAELMFIAPANLTPGQYTVEVRALFGQNNIRIGRLNTPLTIV